MWFRVWSIRIKYMLNPYFTIRILLTGGDEENLHNISNNL